MSLGRQQEYISPEQYLEGEKFSEIRHEYVDGEVYAMSGGSDPLSQPTSSVFGSSERRIPEAFFILNLTSS